jgi:PPOX class probable F420-dependent enzyme
MAGRLTTEQATLLREPQIAHVVTVNPDSTPQVTPMWIDTDGEFVFLNTNTSRVKYRNLKRNPLILISVVDAQHPSSRTVLIKGHADLIDNGALEHIDFLSRKYDGQPWQPVPGEHRVIIRVTVAKAWAAW